LSNAFAQGDQEMVEENETGLVNSTRMVNATLATSIPMNATLAYAAQDGSKIGEEYRDGRENRERI
jgi:hypothetical protein